MYHKETEKLVDKYCVELQTANSELEKLVQDGTRLGQENETLKDNNEHLAVILEETKAEVEKLQNELVIWKQNRFNLFQRLECYETARQKVASEIFAEIDQLITNYFADIISGVTLIVKIAELKKKYTEGEDKPASEEKHFSPADVRNMTPQEVREKYTSIRRSMERW